MVYIFGGLNFPVLEVLFIVAILMLIGWMMFIIGIFYVLKELKEFKVLLGKEGADISKLSADIEKL